MSITPRIIVAISGASGAAYGVTALKLLKSMNVDVHLVVSKSAELTLGHEMGLSSRDLEDYCTERHKPGNIGASIASGSFTTIGMLIAPCSVKTRSEIAYGTADNLIARAADVVLKERRRLVMMVRETPFHLGHLRAMVQATEMGAVIAPPVPGLYAKPKSIDEMVAHSVGRALDLFGHE